MAGAGIFGADIDLELVTLPEISEDQLKDEIPARHSK